MKTYKYRYYRLDKNGQIRGPLQRCPMCTARLIMPNTVELVVSMDGKVTELTTELDRDGWLIDTPDFAVAKGFHSETRCWSCRQVLGEHDRVREEQVVTKLPDTGVKNEPTAVG